MQEVIEARVGCSTIRLSKCAKGLYLMERWERGTGAWELLEEHTEFYIILHSFFDKLCKDAEHLRRRMDKECASNE